MVFGRLGEGRKERTNERKGRREVSSSVPSALASSPSAARAPGIQKKEETNLVLLNESADKDGKKG